MINSEFKYFKNILLFFSLFTGTFICIAQDDIKISHKKTIIDGKQYYVHTIKKGETLPAISKAYNVLQKDIVMENPTAMEGLKPGSALKIPVAEDRSKFTYYTIEKGQTLYSIAKKFNIEISELQKNNPAVANGLKVGMELKIPNLTAGSQNKTDTKKENSDNENIKTISHTVEKGQTLYSLTKKYNITETQLKEANPDLLINGLKVGSILIIPSVKPDNYKKETIINPVNESKLITESKNDTATPVKFNKSINTLPDNEFNSTNNKLPLRIALLAPFHINKNRGYVLKGKKKDEEPPIYPKSLKFIEFYQGMLLALDSLKNTGISTEIMVYDTERDSIRIANITKKKEFENLDLIIGPFFSTNLRHFSDFAKKNNIPIISPLSQSSDFLTDNPVAFQINPSNYTQVTEAADYFSNSKDINYIVISTGKKDDSLLAVHFKTKLFEFYNSKFKTDPPRFQELKYKIVGFKGIQAAIDKEIDNLIFIPATGETFVANILNKLNTLETKYPIYMLGMQSWYSEDNIEQDYLFNLQYTYFTSMYVDYSKEKVLNFVTKYRNIYFADPTKYSFQGYDIMTYFASVLKKFGKNFPDFIVNDTLINKSGLQTDFIFSKHDKKSGFENTKTFLIQYDKEFNISHINTDKQAENIEEEKKQ